MADLVDEQIKGLLATAWSNFDTVERLAVMQDSWEDAFIAARKHAVQMTEIIRQLQRQNARLRRGCNVYVIPPSLKEAAEELGHVVEDKRS